MKDLVFQFNNQAVVSSRTVAEHFNKEHRDVMRSIREIVSAQNCALSFYEKRTYKVRGQYRSYPEYYMNRDGFMLLVMGFTTKPAMQVKLAFIKAFNEMEAKIKGQQPNIMDYNRNIQQLMNENDALRNKFNGIEPYIKLGITVRAMAKDQRISDLAFYFVQGMLGNK